MEYEFSIYDSHADYDNHDNDGVDSSSSFSSYSYSGYYNDSCPTQTLEGARNIIENVAPLYTRSHAVYIMLVLPIFLGVGVIGNILFLYVVCSMTAMRTATNWCLANLAVADLVFLCFGVGEKIWMYQQSPFINDRLSFGALGCAIIPMFIDTSYLASLCMVTLVSVERYYAVCRTQSARTNARKSFFIGLVIASWIASIVIAGSFVPASTVLYTGCITWPDVEPYRNLPNYKGTCIAPYSLRHYSQYLLFGKITPYFFLIIINIWLYACILNGLTRAVRETRITGRADNNIAQRNQVARMLVFNGVIFFICLVPFEVFCLLQAVNMNLPYPKRFLPQHIMVPMRYVCQAMSYVNNIVNPFIYIGMSKKYRDSFWKAVRCRPAERPRRVSAGRSSTTTTTTLSVRINKPLAVY